MKLVGLTGGIASGKSTVSRLLKEQNIPIIDADEIARQVVQPGQTAHKLIRTHFGNDVFHDDGSLDRAKLGQVVFADPEKRKILNQCTHPYVRREMIKQAFFFWLKGAKVVVFDVPLLMEAHLDRYMGTIVVVYCSEVLQLQRLMARDSLTTEQATQRIRAQTPLSEKAELADIVIDNSSDASQLKIQVRNLVKKVQPSTATWLLEYIGLPVALSLVAFSPYYIPRLWQYGR